MSTAPNLKWDKRWLTHAQVVAGWSKNPTDKLGAILTTPMGVHGPLHVACNGFPDGVDETQQRLAKDYVRDLLSLSAIAKVLISAGHDANGATLYSWPLAPTVADALLIIHFRCARVVYEVHSEFQEVPGFTSRTVLEEAGIALTEMR